MITYRKTSSGKWVACGPVDEMKVGKITVTRRDGTTRQDSIVRLGRAFTRDGVEMCYGYLARQAGGPTVYEPPVPADPPPAPQGGPQATDGPDEPIEVPPAPPATQMALCTNCYAALVEPGDTLCRACGGVAKAETPEVVEPEPELAATPSGPPPAIVEHEDRLVSVKDLLATAASLITESEDDEYLRGLSELIAAAAGLSPYDYRVEVCYEIVRQHKELVSTDC